jgi:hypothetical protein
MGRIEELVRLKQPQIQTTMVTENWKREAQQRNKRSGRKIVSQKMPLNQNFTKALAYSNQHKGPAEVMVETPSWLNVQTDDGFRREIVTQGYQVFGTHVLPSGYELAYVPENALVGSTSALDPSGSPSKQPNHLLSSSHSFASALIALIQIIYASVTLYRSRGGQVTKYGYAAFGFTVLPFLIMSFVNLLGNLVTPSYSTLYLIESEIMDEALQRGGSFEGVVGSLESLALDMKETFVFSASFQIHSERLVKIKPGSLKIHMPGDPEPVTEQAMDSTQAPNEPEPGSNRNPLTPPDLVKDEAPPKSPLFPTQESPEQKNDEIKTTQKEDKQDEGTPPLLVVPSCYKFKTAEENRPFTQPSDNKVHLRRGKAILFAVRLVIGAMPLVVVGAMSHFKAGSSTAAERAWIMVWMVLGMSVLGDPSTGNSVVRLVAKFDKDRRLGNSLAGDLAIIAFVAVTLAILATSAIGCFVVVSRMLREYGSCSLLD